jgi:hypothetical protein
MKTYIAIFCLGFLFLSCERNKELKIIDSPIVTVVKLESAIYCGDFEASKEFIDLDQFFSHLGNYEKKNIEANWQKYVRFTHKMAKNKKFINTFPFHKYKIKEKIKGHFSEVILIEKENGTTHNFKLSLQNGNWKVISFDLKR